MSYEVYIDVRHHPKHCDDYEERESTCFKFADQYEHDRLMYVVNGLREFADSIDPRFTCSECGKARRDHKRRNGLYYCSGGVTEHSWWQAPSGP